MTILQAILADFDSIYRLYKIVAAQGNGWMNKNHKVNSE